MSVNDGQPVNAATTNPAFISKNTSDQMANQLDFTNPASAAGPSIIDIQKNINSLNTFLGSVINSVYNQLPIWATSNRGTSTDDVFERVEAIDTAFDPSSGHKHTGASGDAPQISASTLSNINLSGSAIQGTDLTGVTGTSTVVTTQFSGSTPSTNTTTAGVVVNAPYNRVFLTNATNDQDFVDALGNVVYGRLTEATSVWTLSYYSEISGTETAYTFTTSNVRFYFQQLFPVLGASTPVYSGLFFVPSGNATAEVLTATTSTQGKVQLATATPSAVSGSGSAGTANATVANADHTHAGITSLTGDVTGSGTGAVSTTLANTAVTPGSYTSANITVDAKGRVTAAANGTGAGNITPTIQSFTSTGTTAGYLFTVTGGPTVGNGAVYTNNGQTFTIIGIDTTTNTMLMATGTGAPTSSGTLTKSSGTGGTTVTFTMVQTMATYTTPTSPAPLYIRPKLVGAGGGGSGGGSSANPGGNGNPGGPTVFGLANHSFAIAYGGLGGVSIATTQLGGAGGGALLGGAGGGGNILNGLAIPGANGQPAQYTGNSTATLMGGSGGSSALGGAGAGGIASGVGIAATTNSGSGGGGCGSNSNIGQGAGSGGGSGGFLDGMVIGTPASTYYYSIGVLGSGGTAGSAAAGGNGAAGILEVWEYYQ